MTFLSSSRNILVTTTPFTIHCFTNYSTIQHYITYEGEKAKLKESRKPLFHNSQIQIFNSKLLQNVNVWELYDLGSNYRAVNVHLVITSIPAK
jgi:hypothetical protein